MDDKEKKLYEKVKAELRRRPYMSQVGFWRLYKAGRKGTRVFAINKETGKYTPDYDYKTELAHFIEILVDLDNEGKNAKTD